MYTLMLGGMYLAPRASIFVLEPNDLEDVGHSCDGGEERKITFTLYLKDDIFKTQIDALLASCDLGLLLKRRVKTEPWWQYNVKSGYTRRIQPSLEYVSCGYTLAIELVLTLTSSSGVTPVILRVGIPRPDVIVDYALGMTPFPLTLSQPVPTVALSMSPAAKALTVSVPVPDLALSLTPSALAMLLTIPVASAVLGGGGDVAVEMGTYAARPAAGTSGRLYLSTDSPILSFDDGALWTEFYSTYKLTNDTFPSTWINQETASSVTTYGGVQMIGPASAGNDVRLLKKTAPATPYTITVMLFPHILLVNFMACGLAFRQSSDGKLSLLRLTTVSSIFELAVSTFNSPTSAVGNNVLLPVNTQTPVFLRIADNGTNRIYSWSMDGYTWVQIFSETRTTFLTADEVGIFVESGQATYDMSCWFLSWDEG